jgi:hypothetical protein
VHVVRGFSKAARAGVLVLGCAAIGACGAGDEQHRVVVSLESVGAETTEAKTARFSTVIENDDEMAAGPAQRLDGVFDFERLDGTAHHEQGDADDSDWTVVGGVAYSPMLPDTNIDPADPCYGKHWAMFDYPKYAREYEGIEVDQISPLPFDPAAVVGALRHSEATLNEVGSEDVRGKKATQYRVKVNGARLDSRFMSDDFDDRKLVSMEIWVDGDQRLRRARWVLEITWGDVIDSGGTYHETTTVEVWDYGVPIEVTAPPASDSCDFPEFFARSMEDF